MQVYLIPPAGFFEPLLEIIPRYMSFGPFIAHVMTVAYQMWQKYLCRLRTFANIGTTREFLKTVRVKTVWFLG